MSRLTDLIESQEGRRRTAYQDTLGLWTIGVGRLIDARKGGGLSDDEINYLRDNDIKKSTDMVVHGLPWFAGLNEARQAVLVSMCFQMGFNGLLGFKKALGAMRDERWADAEREMRDSEWFRQTPDRAGRMARQMATGEWQ